MNNPFPDSKIQGKVFHGTPARNRGLIKKFRRPEQGVWFAQTEGWVDIHFTGDDCSGEVIECWVNVKNPYTPTEDEFYEYYGDDRIKDDFFKKLKSEGYDAYIQGCESGSISVFDSVEIVNAKTGEAL